MLGWSKSNPDTVHVSQQDTSSSLMPMLMDLVKLDLIGHIPYSLADADQLALVWF